jgi:hypothetical protein
MMGECFTRNMYNDLQEIIKYCTRVSSCWKFFGIEFFVLLSCYAAYVSGQFVASIFMVKQFNKKWAPEEGSDKLFWNISD